MKVFKAISLAIMVSIGIEAQAVNVDGVKVTRLYAQSLNGTASSGAHAIAIDKAIDASCSNRLYIDVLDKELFSTLLAYKIAGTSFNMMYAIGLPSITVAGHLEATCKVYSVY